MELDHNRRLFYILIEKNTFLFRPIEQNAVKQMTFDSYSMKDIIKSAVLAC